MAGRRDPPPGGLVETVVGQTDVGSQIAGLLQRAQHTVWWMLSGSCPGPTRTGLDALLRAVRARGVQVRGVLAAHDSAQVRAFARDPTFAPGEVRQADAVPMWAVVADDTVAVIPVEVGDPRRGVLVVRTPTLAATVTAMISQVYDTGRPLTDPTGGDEPEADRRRRTATSIAERLAVHPRTIARDIEHLCNTYGVTGHFAPGVAVAHHGRLPVRTTTPATAIHRNRSTDNAQTQRAAGQEGASG